MVKTRNPEPYQTLNPDESHTDERTVRPEALEPEDPLDLQSGSHFQIGRKNSAAKAMVKVVVKIWSKRNGPPAGGPFLIKALLKPLVWSTG